jgi:hypothetical protein
VGEGRIEFPRARFFPFFLRLSCHTFAPNERSLKKRTTLLTTFLLSSFSTSFFGFYPFPRLLRSAIKMATTSFPLGLKEGGKTLSLHALKHNVSRTRKYTYRNERSLKQAQGNTLWNGGRTTKREKQVKEEMITVNEAETRG